MTKGKKIRKIITLSKDHIEFINSNFNNQIFIAAIEDLISGYKEQQRKIQILKNKLNKEYEVVIFNQEIILDMLNSLSVSDERGENIMDIGWIIL